jgi:hypothetical protein
MRAASATSLITGQDSVSLWQAELSYGLKNHSGINEAPSFLNILDVQPVSNVQTSLNASYPPFCTS